MQYGYHKLGCRYGCGLARTVHTAIDSHRAIYHHLRHACCLSEVILSNQQVALLSDPWRIAQPRANHVNWELSLEFCLSASSHRVEQSWPTRNTGAVVASFRSVGSSSSNPSLCWLRPDTVERRPHTRSYGQRSRTLRRG